MNGRDIYYDSYNGIQKTPVLGTISYEWKGTKTPFATATDGDFKSLGTDAHASFTIPSGVDTYYVKLSVKNKIDDGVPQESTVNITFHVSPAHTHSYNIIKNVVAENKIIGLLTIIGFMAIYMLYTRSLFIAQGIIIGVFWLIKMLIGYRIKVRKSELESGEIKSDRKEKIIFIAVAVFILMVQMHQ